MNEFATEGGEVTSKSAKGSSSPRYIGCGGTKVRVYRVMPNTNSKTGYADASAKSRKPAMEHQICCHRTSLFSQRSRLFSPGQGC